MKIQQFSAIKTKGEQSCHGSYIYKKSAKDSQRKTTEYSSEKKEKKKTTPCGSFLEAKANSW